MRNPEYDLLIPLLPKRENHLMPMNKIIKYDNTLVCGCRDGSLYIKAADSFENVKKYDIHHSWITSIDLNNIGMVSGSYDMTIKFCSSDSFFNLDKDPIFLTQNAHKDYIFSVSLNENRVLSSSSDQSIIISEICSTSIRSLRTISTNNSIYCSKLIGDEGFLGSANGNLSHIDFKDPQPSLRTVHESGSSIKSLATNKEKCAIGCLNGVVNVYDIRTWRIISSVLINDPVVSIEPYSDGFMYYSKRGIVNSIDTESEISFLAPKKVSCGIQVYTSDGDDNFILSHDDGEICKYKPNGEIIQSVKPDDRYVFAERESDSTKVQLKTLNGHSYLYDLESMSIIEEDYVHIEKSVPSPAFYFPISFEVSTGIPRMRIPPILPKIIDKKFEPQRNALKNIIKSIIRSNVIVSSVDSNNKIVSCDPSSLGLPYWFRYIM